MEHAIQIDSGKYHQDGHCDFDDLRQAAERLLQGNEQELQAIKDEPWYRRVFDLVTFSNKKDVRVSSHIQTLAQAQGIFAEILARLSNTDHHVMTLLESVSSDIKRLSDNDIRLARRIVAIEYADCNFADQDTIKGFSEHENKILASLITGLSEATNPNRQQQRYAKNLFDTLQIQEANAADPATLLQKVSNIDHKKHMLHCCLEYIFLGNEALALDQIDEHFAESFDFGKKTWTELKQRIDRKHKTLGIDGFVESAPETEVPDEFVVTLDFDFAEEIIEQAPREDIEIKGILTIASGETKEFRNANLFFGSFINCEGTLILRNCSIDYGDTAAQVRILLKDGGQLQIEQSEIICLLSAEPQFDFITCEGRTTISIRNSILSDCSHFIKSADSLEISDCIIRNPGDKLIAASYSSVSCNLLRTSFIFENPSDFKKSEYKKYGNLLAFEGDFTGNSEITQCAFIANNCFDDDSKFTLIYSCNGKISDCVFDGVSNAIKNAAAAERCSFKNVFNAIDSYNIKNIKDCNFDGCGKVIDLSSTDEEIASISNCTFLQCSNVFSGKNLKVTSSQIHDCSGYIIDGTKMQFELCDFINIQPKESRSGLGFGGGSIGFFSTNKNDGGISLKHCQFDGYKGNGQSPFARVAFPKSGMKTGITFEECTFENFSAPNGISSLFEEDATVEGFFSNSTIQVIRTVNCTGLDRINKEGSESSRPKPATIATPSWTQTTAAAAVAAGAISVVPIATAGLAAVAVKSLLSRK